MIARLSVAAAVTAALLAAPVGQALSADPPPPAPGGLPCGWTGADAVALATLPGGGLALACGGEPAAGNQAKTFYASLDGGRRWVRRGGLRFGPGYVAGLAACDATHWVLAEARLPSLMYSTDGGRRWHRGVFRGTPAPVEGWGEVSCPGGRTLVAVPWTLNGSVLAVSFDHGRSWREVPFRLPRAG